MTQGKPKKPKEPVDQPVDQQAKPPKKQTGLTADQLSTGMSMADWLKSKKRRKK